MFRPEGLTVDVDVTVQDVDAHSKFISGYGTARDTHGAWLKCYYFTSRLFSPYSHIAVALEETDQRKKTWQPTLMDRSVLWSGHRRQRTRSGCLRSRVKSLKLPLQFQKVQSPLPNMVAQPWGGREACETDDGPRGLHAQDAHTPVMRRLELSAAQGGVQR